MKTGADVGLKGYYVGLTTNVGYFPVIQLGSG